MTGMADEPGRLADQGLRPARGRQARGQVHVGKGDHSRSSTLRTMWWFPCTAILGIYAREARLLKCIVLCGALKQMARRA